MMKIIKNRFQEMLHIHPDGQPLVRSELAGKIVPG